MTIIEAILEDLRPYPVRTKLIEKKCTDSNLDGSDEYTSAHRASTIPILIEVLTQFLVLGSVSEGGVSLNFTDVKERIRLLKIEIGQSTEGLEPTVKILDI